ncbi:hypothetical protein SAMN05216581_4218 [Pseudomonas asplenii]|uniref:Uncharacterized protein n=1 Tax=Pseudomonas asplenii TaxID=53407 RepID=A0A1H6NZS2_9PSED|nr:hypothetical protein [Pseudomonas fuscovaginae]SEI20419.1 hypothetical protein SAMN05216581_4218 [Pseudomonas fuscovaginae]
MEISNRPLPTLTPGTPTSPVTLPSSSTPPPPLTEAQKEAAKKLRDLVNPPVTPPVTATPEKTSLIDEVV